MSKLDTTIKETICSAGKECHGNDCQGKRKLRVDEAGIVHFKPRSAHPNKFCCHRCYSLFKTDKEMPEETLQKMLANKPGRRLYEKRCAYIKCRQTFTSLRRESKYCDVKHAALQRGINAKGKPRKSKNSPTALRGGGFIQKTRLAAKAV